MKVIFDTGGLDNAPPSPDLYAFRSFRLRRNHPERTLCTSGFIRNIGNEGIRRSFKTAIGCTYYRDGVQRSTQRIFTIETDMPIGMQIETPCMRNPLIYIDEDPTAFYTFEILVDVDNEISELKSSNNRYKLENWYFLSPNATRKTDDEFIIDTSPKK